MGCKVAKENTVQCLDGLGIEDQYLQSPQNFLVKKVARLDNILTQIDESTGSSADIHKLVAEAKLIIKKRQRLIKIADKNRDGWLAVQEYETDDFASDSEDEKIHKPKLPLRRSEKKRRVPSVTLRKNLNLLVIFSFFAVSFTL